MHGWCSLATWVMAIIDSHLSQPSHASPISFVSTGARLVQLGDLGHGKHGSGGLKCFEYAKDFLDGFGARTALVLGNHGG